MTTAEKTRKNVNFGLRSCMNAQSETASMKGVFWFGFSANNVDEGLVSDL